MKVYLALLILLFSPALFSQKNYLFVGTYTNTGSEGIYVYEFDPKTGKSKLVNKTASENPSYLVLSPNQKNLYAVNENGGAKPGTVSAFSFNRENGSMTFLNSKPTGGDHPCYININKTGKHVIAGNYSGGSVTVFPVLKNGALADASQHVMHLGKSVHPSRQEKAHVHAVVFSPTEKHLFVPDLGIDKIMTYSYDLMKDKPLKEMIGEHTLTEPGSGPRHLIFHPFRPFAYLVEELTGTVSAFRYGNGRLHFLQRISAHPDNHKGGISSADIHISPDGRFLYISNRGDANNIAIFMIEPSIGTLRIKGFHPAGGKKPRNFMIDPSGNFLLVANQDSNSIVVLRRNKSNGMLSETGETINVPSPVCLKMLQ